MSIVLYGAGPVYPDRWPGLTPDDGASKPLFPPGTIGIGTTAPIGTIQPTVPLAPETADQLRARLVERKKWLENELRMHASWEQELATINSMLAPPPTEERTER